MSFQDSGVSVAANAPVAPSCGPICDLSGRKEAGPQVHVVSLPSADSVLPKGPSGRKGDPTPAGMTCSLGVASGAAVATVGIALYEIGTRAVRTMDMVAIGAQVIVLWGLLMITANATFNTKFFCVASVAVLLAYAIYAFVYV